MPIPEQLELIEFTSQKRSGAYYTPDGVARSLVSWAVRRSSDRMLDPSCGDGIFLQAHRKCVGVEQDIRSASTAMARAPWALIHEGDFFAWAANTKERFEFTAGNPPFIRYQHFNGEVRTRSLKLCAKLGAIFSGLSSSWAPFLVATAGLLKQGGRMAFVVPAEIGHAPYAKPLLEFLVRNFSQVHLVAVKKKLFPNLSEDCWLLYTEGYGGRSRSIDLTITDSFTPSSAPPRPTLSVPVEELRESWKMRLRSYLLPSQVRQLYLHVSEAPGSYRLGDVATIGIGYVTGDNDFFHLRPSTAERLGISKHLLCPSVRNGKSLRSKRLTPSIIEKWYRADDQMLLLRLQKDTPISLAVRRYLDTEAGHQARQTYKCRNRDPWYSVPDVKTPNFFLTYMSGLEPNLVKNDANCTCTNSVHSVVFKRPTAMAHVEKLWSSPFVQLSCELEGHPLGGGMLKIEPREAGQILIPSRKPLAITSTSTLLEGLSTMRQWRHCVSN